MFGERNAAHDHFCSAEIAAWHSGGLLERVSLAFSRDGGALRYVQHALANEAQALRDWVADGAAIYVCGSLKGMAADVHATLESRLEQDGRYRRDVY